jgi:hypothetical protein
MHARRSICECAYNKNKKSKHGRRRMNRVKLNLMWWKWIPAAAAAVVAFCVCASVYRFCPAPRDGECPSAAPAAIKKPVVTHLLGPKCQSLCKQSDHCWLSVASSLAADLVIYARPSHHKKEPPPSFAPRNTRRASRSAEIFRFSPALHHL